jgi:hypothetical protein
MEPQHLGPVQAKQSEQQQSKQQQEKLLQNQQAKCLAAIGSWLAAPVS